ncbi:putative alpha-L-fucosidase [Dioscorea sansibarensis]
MASSPSLIPFSFLLLLIVFFPSSFSIEFNYPAVFSFGDSNSDTGVRIAAGLEELNPPYGETYFLRPSGRFSDGRLIIDFLMMCPAAAAAGCEFGFGFLLLMEEVDEMDMPFLSAYLDSVGAPSFQKGCNFAAGGSTILPASPTSVSPFSFGIQISQFFRFKARVTELLTKGNKFEKYIPQLYSFNQGLYMFDMGQNDLAGSFYSETDDQVVASIPIILLEFETGIRKLYGQGARRFWIQNTGPLGCLPQTIALFGKDPSKLDELGCVTSHNRAAKLFNLQLHALCTKLQAEFSNASITYVDIFSIKFDLISNYSRYGFEHPTTACCGHGGPPLNYNSRVGCGQTKILNGNTVTANVCNDTTEYINWDGIHYTEAANLHVSSQVLTGKYFDPPFADKMPFLLKL